MIIDYDYLSTIRIHKDKKWKVEEYKSNVSRIY